MFGELDEGEKGVEVRLVAEIVVQDDEDEDAQVRRVLDELRGLAEDAGLPVNICRGE
jgi:polysaccharide deacetylase 2 family uncharacterized protein YibQ